VQAGLYEVIFCPGAFYASSGVVLDTSNALEYTVKIYSLGESLL